jgi:hypothetical protein
MKRVGDDRHVAAQHVAKAYNHLVMGNKYRCIACHTNSCTTPAKTPPATIRSFSQQSCNIDERLRRAAKCTTVFDNDLRAKLFPMLQTAGSRPRQREALTEHGSNGFPQRV